MALGRRPQPTAASFSYTTLANIENSHAHSSVPEPCVGTIHPLSALLRSACKGDRGCRLNHAHLMHTSLAHLRAGMANALTCTSHTARGHDCCRSIAHLACHSLLSFWNLLSTQESSAASQKCRFRVRHFGRVFVLPYKYTTAQ